ncbi:ubiquitin conjugating enzyme E2 [Acrasis kona]|uniref:Ubiquitin conjugating enzyme E2 n=1 Tax=Acrasis kona TaxID=1008807 RepID=A0AAW2ZE63_9EUKA
MANWSWDAIHTRIIKPESAIKRLHKDYAELIRNPLDMICACPVSEKTFLLWHANMMGAEGSRYAGVVFHLSLLFPNDYPLSPPDVRLLTTVHRSHVYGSWICLDMLETHYTNELYSGWSTAYSLSSILLQLQSYLFDDKDHKDDPEYFRPIPSRVKECVRNARLYKCSECPHNMRINKPWPYTPWMKLRLNGKFKPKPATLKRRENAPKKPKKQKNILNGEKFEDYGLLEGRLASVAIEGEWIEEEWEEPAQDEEKNSLEQVKTLLTDLPMEVLVHILSCLSEVDLKNTKMVPNTFVHQASLECCRLFDIKRDPMMCFHTKLNHLESVLGIGINLRRNPISNVLSYADSPLDVLSWKAYTDHRVVKGVWRQPFEFWLPLYINKEHAGRAWPLFRGNCL